MGYEQTKDWVVFIAKLSNGLSKAMEDGKIGIGDAISLLPAMSAAFPALAGSGEIMSEISDLDESERQELVAVFKEELDLADDQVEAYAESGFEIATKLAKFIVDLKNK